MHNSFYILETVKTFPCVVYPETLVDDILNDSQVETAEVTRRHYQLRLKSNHNCLASSTDLDKILSRVTFLAYKYRSPEKLEMSFSNRHVGDDLEYYEKQCMIHSKNYLEELEEAVKSGLSVPYKRVNLGILEEEVFPGTERKPLMKKVGLKKRKEKNNG